MSIRKVKSEIRILGWDDSSFERGSEGRIPIVGSIVRGGKPYLDGVLVEEVEIDGEDATDVIIGATNNTKHKGQLRVVMLDGITFAGFNTVDIEEVSEETELPVIAVTRKKTDFEKFRKAMENVPDFEERWKCVERAGEFEKLDLGEDGIFFQYSGIDENKARKVLKTSISRSLIPEPVRISHLIASAIHTGESIARP